MGKTNSRRNVGLSSRRRLVEPYWLFKIPGATYDYDNLAVPTGKYQVDTENEETERLYRANEKFKQAAFTEWVYFYGSFVGAGFAFASSAGCCHSATGLVILGLLVVLQVGSYC